MQLGELARQIAHERTARFSEREIEGISTDSKHVMHGDLFVCFRGGEHDGHDFAAEAVAAGAASAAFGRGLGITRPPDLRPGRRGAPGVLASGIFFTGSAKNG